MKQRLHDVPRRVWLPALILLLAPGAAIAGEIYGAISEGANRVGEGVPVEIKCGAKTYPPQKTDKAGAYHLAVEDDSKCTLTVRYKDQAPTISVVSYADPVQLDLVLELKDGKYTLRRK